MSTEFNTQFVVHVCLAASEITYKRNCFNKESFNQFFNNPPTKTLTKKYSFKSWHFTLNQDLEKIHKRIYLNNKSTKNLNGRENFSSTKSEEEKFDPGESIRNQQPNKHDFDFKLFESKLRSNLPKIYCSSIFFDSWV